MMSSIHSPCDLIIESPQEITTEPTAMSVADRQNVIVPATMTTVTSVAAEESETAIDELLTVDRDPADPTAQVSFRDAGRDYHLPQFEAAVLSVMINRPALIAKAGRELDAGDFFRGDHLQVFGALLHQSNVGGDTSPAGLLTYLGNLYSDELPEWTMVVNTCAATTANFKDLSGYIHQLKEAAAIRGGKDFCPHRYSEHFCAHLFIKRMPPMRCVDQTLFRYQDGVWSEADGNMIRPDVLDVIHPSHRQARRADDVIKHVEHALQVPKGIFVGGHKFTADRNVLINTNNCVVEVQADANVKALPHSQDCNFTRKLMAAYEPSAGCPHFMRVLNEALPDPDDRLLFQAFAGYTLLPSCEHEAALVCFGPGGTGKSTLAGAISDVLGRELCGAAGLEELCQHGSYSLPLLKSKQLNLASELNGTEIEASANFKKLVSGEWLNVRQIYGAPEDMQTTCKLMFLTNNMPMFKWGTDAETRRLRILPFLVKPANNDPQLKDKLRVEISGILNWMIEGLIWVLRNGTVPTGGTTAQKMIEQFHRGNDPVGSFESECLVFGPDETVIKNDLYESFALWCKAAGLPAEKLQNRLFKTMLHRHPTLQDQRRTIKGKREALYLGVGLAADAPAPDTKSNIPPDFKEKLHEIYEARRREQAAT